MDNKTKLFVTDLSAVGLSTDYLYAKDSNIKTDVKIEPVDNGGEKIATITVNGEATEISAINNGYTAFDDYTAFEVFPTNKDIPSGMIDDQENVGNYLRIENYKGTRLPYSEGVPKQMTFCLTLGIVDTKEQDDNDVVIDWGDGNKTEVKSTPVTPSILDDEKPEGIYEYIKGDASGLRLFHTYENPGKYIVKVYGKDYFCLRSTTKIESDADYERKSDSKYNLISRVFDTDLLVASNLTNVASIGYNNKRILRIAIPYLYDFKNITNWSYAFTRCRNLYELGWSNSTSLSKNTAYYCNYMFAMCYNLHRLIHGSFNPPGLDLPPITNMQNNQYSGGYSYMFYECKNLEADVLDLLPAFGFIGTNVNVKLYFAFCDKLYCSDYDKLSSLLWNDASKKWISENMFYHCSDEVRSHVPQSFGGKLSDSIIKRYLTIDDIPSTEPLSGLTFNLQTDQLTSMLSIIIDKLGGEVININ